MIIMLDPEHPNRIWWIILFFGILLCIDEFAPPSLIKTKIHYIIELLINPDPLSLM
ncbi:MAG: hypothetical protein HQK79_21955 [Desulfobacterales bacterium]|nr:hypothetical protein [Desulfobacterales bacterium]